MSAGVLVLPDDVAASIEFRNAAWGVVELRRAERERALVVSGHWHETPGGRSAWSDRAGWRSDLKLWELAGESAAQGLYFRASADLNAVQYDIACRDGALAIDHFREHLDAWRDPGDNALALTYAPDADPAERWRAWRLASGQATHMPLARQLSDFDVLAPLAGLWPYERLAGQRVLVLGVGSIGAAACEALLGYGVRSLTLVDCDHLLAHNFARHRLAPDQLGRLKVTAMADHLIERDAEARIVAAPLEILHETDELRPLVLQASAVLVATDGVASRRVANHLACWARRPAVFACELRNQGIGELVRYRPGATGCLWCLREELVDRESLDPEPDLDRGYGTGNRHFPTTAVGSDLWLLGDLAAKLTVATLLERQGVPDQRAPADHAIIGLRPTPDLPDPFNVTRAGEVKWAPTAAPRADCPSCGHAAEQAA